FEQGAAHGVGGDACSVPDAEQPAHQANVEEVELGCLDQTFAEVFEVGRDSRHQVAGFEHGQPFACGNGGDATVGTQGAEVQQLPGTGGAHAHETLELGEVAYGDQLPDVALQVGGHI